MISFDSTAAEASIIVKIAQRAVVAAAGAGFRYTLLEAQMDVTAVHCNGNPLRLEEFLNASAGDFAHDVFGIRRHLDRATGKLNDHFSPRFTAHSN